jgi:iron complex outermembrane receptor protein
MEIVTFIGYFYHSSIAVWFDGLITFYLCHHLQKKFTMTLKKKQFVLLLIIFLSANFAFGQSGVIKGTVSGPDAPLAFANVILKNATDSSMTKVELTTETGEFSFKSIPFAKYFIEISYLGIAPFGSDVFTLEQALLTLDEFRTETVSSDLATVEVVASRPLIEVQADKTVFNVENTLNSTGTDGFQLLRKAPGVIIDNNDNIILEGKTGVQIYINGKPSPLSGEDLTNFLRSLQSSDIAAIEIITQPSSKYDAAGNAGIINIRLKKDKRLGTNGTVAAGYSRGKNNRYNGSISFNNRTKKTNVFGTYSNNFGETWSFINLDRIQEGVRYNSQTEALDSRTTHNSRIGFDVFPHANHTFGVLLSGTFYERDSKGLTSTPISPVGTEQPDQILKAQSIINNNNANLAGNINYRFADTLGHELTFDLDYGRYDRERTSFQPNEYLNGEQTTQLFERNFRMITPTAIDIFTAKLDYSQNLLGAKVGIGAKYSLVNTDNTFDFYDVIEGNDEFNADRSNVFLYSENINAAYINISKKWEKWNVQAGLRAEQTISEGDLTSTQTSEEDNVKRNYLDWFPSGGITYTPNFTSSWALTFSRRIQRPNYQTLNPFESQIDELSFSKGNPFLQPQYTNNVKLSHTYKYRLTTSISYSYIRDFFANITDTLGSTRNFLITRNIANQEVWNLGVSYPFQVAKWWSVYLSVNAFHASYQGSDEKFRAIDQSTVSFYGQNTFSLPKGFRLEVSGWFSSPSVWGGTYLTRSMGSLDLALQKKFLNDRLSVRLAVSDVLFTSFWRADMRFGDLYIDGSGGWESRQGRINISYAFGNNEVKNNRKRKTGLEDEDSRIGND